MLHFYLDKLKSVAMHLWKRVSTIFHKPNTNNLINLFLKLSPEPSFLVSNSSGLCGVSGDPIFVTSHCIAMLDELIWVFWEHTVQFALDSLSLLLLFDGEFFPLFLADSISTEDIGSLAVF